MAHKPSFLELARTEANKDINEWDPRRLDFENKDFNSYTTGPGRNLPSTHNSPSFMDRESNEDIALYVTGIPVEMEEIGLRHLFSKAGTVTRVHKRPPKEPSNRTTFGFVHFKTVKESELALRLFGNYRMGDKFVLKCKYSLTEEERAKRRKEMQENDEWVNHLNRKKQESSNNDSSYGAKKPESMKGVANSLSPQEAQRPQGRAKANALFELAGLPAPSAQTNQSGRSTPSDPGYATSTSGKSDQDYAGRTNGYSESNGYQNGNSPRRNKGGKEGSRSPRKDEGSKSTESSPRGKSQGKEDSGMCSSCSKPGQFRCGLCKVITYCSQECQRQDWDSHKKMCRNIKAESDLEAEFAERFEIDVGEDILLNHMEQPQPTRRIMKSSVASESLPNKPVEVIACYVKGDCIYLQKREHLNQRQRLQEDLMKTYRNTPDNIGEGSYLPVVGELCAAQFSCDNSWYRAEVLRIQSDATLSVVYSDYGNKEDVPATRVRKLTEALTQLPIQCIACGLYGVAPVDGTWADDVLYTVTSAELKAKCVQMDGDKSLVVLTSAQNGMDVGDALVQSGYARVVEQSSPRVSVPKQPIVKRSFPSRDTFQVGDVVEAVLTHAVSPAQFWVVDARVSSDLTKMNKDLGKYMQTATRNTSYRPQIDDCVAGLFQGEWYRGVVNNVQAQNALVQYVDFGNQEEVNIADIHVLPDQFLNTPPRAFCCSLFDAKPVAGSAWPVESIQFFMTFIYQTVSVKIEAVESSQVYNATLRDSHGDLLDLMVSAGVARRMSARPGIGKLAPQLKDIKCTLDSIPTFIPQGPFQANPIEVFSPELFYVHADDPRTHEALNSVQIELSQIQPSGPYQPMVGEVVLAKFSADKMWYRALVLAVWDITVSVLFIDWGNQDLVAYEDLMKLPPSLVPIPRAALKCGLNNLKGTLADGSWSPEAKQVLIDALRQCVMEVLQVVEGVAQVEMTSGNVSVNQTLLDQGLARKDTGSQLSVQVGASRLPTSPRSAQQAPQAEGGVNPQAVQRRKKFYIDCLAKTTLPEKCIVHVPDTSIASPTEFYVLIVSQANFDALSAMTERLTNYYLTTPADPTFTPEAGELCVVYIEDDKAAYRCFVSEVKENGKYLVNYVDYSNEDTQDIRKIRPFEERFTRDPMFAVCCSLACYKSNQSPTFSSGELGKFRKLIQNRLVSTVKSHSGDKYYIDAVVEESGIDIGQYMMALQEFQHPNHPQVVQPPMPAPGVQNQNTPSQGVPALAAAQSVNPESGISVEMLRKMLADREEEVKWLKAMLGMEASK